MPTGVVTQTVRVEGLPDTLCVEVAPGQWCWTTPGFAWKFNERIAPPQPNVAIHGEGQYFYQLRSPTLKSAVIYTMGFSYGYKNGVVQGKADADGSMKMVQEVFKESLERDKQRPEVKADGGIT